MSSGTIVFSLGIILGMVLFRLGSAAIPVILLYSNALIRAFQRHLKYVKLKRQMCKGMHDWTTVDLTIDQDTPNKVSYCKKCKFSPEHGGFVNESTLNKMKEYAEKKKESVSEMQFLEDSAHQEVAELNGLTVDQVKNVMSDMSRIQLKVVREMLMKKIAVASNSSDITGNDGCSLPISTGTEENGFKRKH